MAELLIKVGATPSYNDGDILCAFNRRRVRCVHAAHICHIEKAGFTKDGLRPIGSVAQALYERTHQYRFERISTREVLRVEISTGNSELFSDKPNEKGEYMHAEDHIAYCVKHNLHAIFGRPGEEAWYGGAINTSHEALDLLWNDIANKTGELESNPEYTLWPYGTDSLKDHLGIRVPEFDDKAGEALVSSVYDAKEAGVVLAKRAQKIDWRSCLDEVGVTEAEVLDRTISVAKLSVNFDGKLIVNSKSQSETRLDKIDKKQVAVEQAEVSAEIEEKKKTEKLTEEKK